MDVIRRRSLPSRERGLKCVECWMDEFANGVAPLAGAWIEMSWNSRTEHRLHVAPLAEAWIEIYPFRVSWRDEISRSPRGSVD